MQSNNMMSAASSSGGGGSYLLDTYTTATLSYSAARLLKSGVSFPLTAKRTSDGALRNIGTVAGVTDTADLASWAGASNALVEVLYNQCGDAAYNLATPSSDTDKPKVVNSGLQLINGRLCMYFDGSDYLSSLNPLSLLPALSGNLTTSIFVVFQKGLSPSNGCLFGWGNISSSGAAIGLYDDGTSQIAFAGGNSKLMSNNAAATTYVMSIIKTPGAINTTTNIYRNGANISLSGGSSSTPSVAGNTVFQLGRWAGLATNFLNGYVQEIIIFPDDQSANRTAIEANLMSFYSVSNSNTRLLLHLNGADGSTTFTDSSSINATITSNGATISTAQSKFGGSSAFFTGTASYLLTPNNGNYSIGNNDFTIEGWQYSASSSVERCLFDNRQGGEGIALYSSVSAGGWPSSTDRLTAFNNTTHIAGSGTTQFTPNTWQHWAVTRQGTTLRGFIEGNLVWTATDSRTYAAGTSCRIGASIANQNFVGYMDEVRLTIGTALYTANFTPSSVEFSS